MRGGRKEGTLCEGVCVCVRVCVCVCGGGGKEKGVTRSDRGVGEKQ